MNDKANSYLTHIDGLRAVALLGVLLFHFEVPPFKGGFAGVDVFLTISGYLITRNIISTHSEACPFSLRAFYVRRFFRLYPAATATVFVAVLTTSALFPNDLAKEAAQSGLAAMLVSANTFFHAKSGYFDSSATVKPLLHMWSLSLEEQFYLLWAPLLMFHFSCFAPDKAVPRMNITLACLTLLSLLAGIHFSTYAQSFAFFHLPSRIFQFSLGAALAVRQHKCKNDCEPDELSMPRRSSHSFVHSFSTLIALAAVLTSYVVLPENAPSIAMLPVNLATVVLLAFPDTPVCKHVLSSTLFVFIGRLSYSAYLVHWPLYVLSRYVLLALNEPKPNPIVMMLSTVVLALILKTTMEDPVRRGARISRIIFCVLVVITMLLCSNESFDQSDTLEPVLHQVEIDANRFLFKKPFPVVSRSDIMEIERQIVMRRKRTLSRVSRTGDFQSSSEPLFTVFGNSFASHIIPALHLIGKRRKVWFRIYAAASCSIFAPSQFSLIPPSDRNCRKVNEVMWDAVDNLPPNSTLVLAALWGFKSQLSSFLSRIAPIADELAKRNVKGVFIGEPPGLAEHHESFFDCLDLFAKPVGRTIITALKGENICGFDFRDGAHSVPGRLLSNDIYREGFSKHVKNIKFVNVLESMCNVTKDDKDVSVSAVCDLPTLSLLDRFPKLTDPGYKRDRAHLTILGSGAMSHVYERLLLDPIT